MYPDKFPDFFDKCKIYTSVLARVLKGMQQGIYPYFRSIEAQSENKVLHKGKWFIQIASNDYLGLSQHPKVKEAAIKAVEKYGSSCCGSRFLNGTFDIHIELEKRLAKFFEKEEALVFSTGFLTNLGTISALSNKNDIIFSDRENHASILDGCRLSFAKTLKFKHNDAKNLEEILKNSDKNKGKFIVVDGVFSMIGNLSNLPSIVSLCNKYSARLMVDEAHGIGVLGKKGRGATEHFNVLDKVDIIMGTFSKSLASLGGFIASSKEVTSFIKHLSREMIFTAALPPASVAAALASLDIIEKEPERISKLWENIKYMQNGFKELGFNIANTQSAIIPVIIGGDESTGKFGKILEDEGIFANVVVSPAVPSGNELIRTSYKATHTKEDLDFVLEKFKKAGRELGIIK